MMVLEPIWIGIAIALLCGGWFGQRYLLKDHWQRILNPAVLAYLRKDSVKASSLLPQFMLAAAIALALSQPATPTSKNQALYANAEVWLVLVDVSKSMDHNDLAPTRLEALKPFLSQLQTAAESRPLGLIVYAGDAFLAHPPTVDRQTFDDFSQALATDLIEIKGTRPDRALSLTQSIIEQEGLQRARIWLLTDTGGLDQRTDAVAFALAEAGHQLDVILSAHPDSELPEPVELSKAQSTAKSGGGELFVMDALGKVDGDPLDPQLLSKKSRKLELELGAYTLWSQWIILLLLPAVLYLMRRRYP